MIVKREELEVIYELMKEFGLERINIEEGHYGSEDKAILELGNITVTYSLSTSYITIHIPKVPKDKLVSIIKAVREILGGGNADASEQ